LAQASVARESSCLQMIWSACCDWGGHLVDVESCVPAAPPAAAPSASPASRPRVEPERTGASSSNVKVSRDHGSHTDGKSIGGQTTIRSAHRQPALGFCGRGRRLVLSIEFQVLIVLAILTDIVAFVAESSIFHRKGEEHVPKWTTWISYATLALYVLEIVLKLLCFSLPLLVRDKWFLLDVVIVIASAALINGPGGIIVAARLSKVVFRSARCIAKGVRLALRLRPLRQAAMKQVSRKKSRYVDLDNNFDLDLSYVSTDLVAMGAPATGFVNSFVRNPLTEVARFFAFNHLGNFRVYNCCPEMPYPEEPFIQAGGSVAKFDIQDHSPPLMEQFVTFLQDAREFRRQSIVNMIAIHCKAGRGRTGALCCAWLLYARRRPTAEEALEMFACRRTDARPGGRPRGAETPSQVRYVHQVLQHLQRTDSWFRSPRPPPPVPAPPAELLSLSFEDGFFAHPEKLKRVRILVQALGGATPATETTLLETDGFDPTEAVVVPLSCVVVQGDVRISFFEETGPGGSVRGAPLAAPGSFHEAKGLLAYFCFHTAFMYPDTPTADMVDEDTQGTLRLNVMEIDKACRSVHTARRPGMFGESSGVALRFAGGRLPRSAPRVRSPSPSPGGSTSARCSSSSPAALRVMASAWDGQGHNASSSKDISAMNYSKQGCGSPISL